MPSRNCCDARRGIRITAGTQRSARPLRTIGHPFVRIGEFVKRFDSLVSILERESRWSYPVTRESATLATNRIPHSSPPEIRRRQMQIEIATERLQALRDRLREMVEVWLAGPLP